MESGVNVYARHIFLTAKSTIFR